MPSAASAAAKARKKRLTAEQRAEQRRIQAENAERLAEASAPRAQRLPVAGLRGPRIALTTGHDGKPGRSYARSNPIRELRARSRSPDRDTPRVTDWHLAASEALLQADELAGEGVGMGHSDYSRGGGSSAPQTGYISQYVVDAVLRQVAAREERDRARLWLGEAWPVIAAVVLRGVAPTAWAEMRHCRYAAAMAELVEALDRLVEFYPAIERRRHGTAPIRAVEIRAATF